MPSKLPEETIKPAYPLGDAQAEAPVSQGGIGAGKDKKDTPAAPQKAEPKKIDEPQTDGE